MVSAKIWIQILVIIAATNLVTSDGIRACGDHLSDLLMMVCESNYYGKRSNQLDGPKYKFGKDKYKTSDYNDIMRMDLPPFFRNLKTRGIVNECCFESCSMDTLRLYCDN